MRAAKFSIDTYGDQVFEGFSNDQEWNGWACPLFNFEQAQRIVDACKQGKGHAFYDADRDQFVFYLDGTTSDDPEVYTSEEVEGNKLYPIGAFNWIWEEQADTVIGNTKAF
jgi:hypothetical protein